jgi:hypothetical protein
LHFCHYLPFEEDLALYLNNFEYSFPKNDMYYISLKFWRIENFCVFLRFRYYLPMEKRVGLHMNNFESPSPKDDVHASAASDHAFVFVEESVFAYTQFFICILDCDCVLHIGNFSILY